MIFKWYIYFTAKKETAREKMLKEEERILESVAEKKGTLDLYTILIYRYLKYLNFLFLVFDLF